MKIFKIMAFVILACSSQAIGGSIIPSMKFQVTCANNENAKSMTATFSDNTTSELHEGYIALHNHIKSITISCESSQLKMTESGISKLNGMFNRMESDIMNNRYKHTGKAGTLKVNAAKNNFFLTFPGYGDFHEAFQK
jgi:hypothetical protein